MFATLLAILMTSAGGPDAVPTGTIHGAVLNGSRGGEPVANAKVQLRAGANGLLETLTTTTTDLYGKFSFRSLPLDPALVYLPGANRDAVHYPGQRLQLDPGSRIAHAKIVVFDAVSSPSPLAAARHHIDIEVDQHAMAITETITVVNASRATYVGESSGDKTPVTLRLAIPEHFDRVTFDREFYGRRFRVVDRHLATDLPWPPGSAMLELSYRVPLDKCAGRFRRTLDLPGSNVRLRVRGAEPRQLSCNLASPTQAGEHVVFAAADNRLPAGYTIELQIDDLPIPWTRYARWTALAALGLLVLATYLLNRRSNVSDKRSDRQSSSIDSNARSPLKRSGRAA